MLRKSKEVAERGLYNGPIQRAVTIRFKAEEGEPAEIYNETVYCGVDGGFLHVYSTNDPTFDDLIAVYNCDCILAIERG